MEINFQRKKIKIKKSFKTFANDLVTLPYIIKVLITFLTAFVILNNIIDLNHFIDYKNNPSIWVFENNSNYPLWKKLFLILSGVATIAHIICNILLAYGKISTFFWGILGVISYGLYTVAWDYWGDMQLNLFFFLPMQIIGYQLWKNHLLDNETITIKQFNWKESLIVIYAAVMIGVLFYFEIPEYSRVVIGSYAYDGNKLKNVIPHLFDASTNALSIVGQVLMLLRYREQWIMWMTSNLLQLAMFSGIANGKINVNMIILWIFAIFNAAIGIKKWFFDANKVEKNQIPYKT